MPSFDRTSQPVDTPSPWVMRWAPLIRPGGVVLDVAAGHGRHARALLGRGVAVVAADIDVAGLSDLRARAEVVEVDLESGPWPFAGRRFDGIVVANYLHRPHFAPMAEAL